MQTNRHGLMHCKSCYWHVAMDCAAQPFCPECGNRLTVSTGTREEIQTCLAQVQDRYHLKIGHGIPDATWNALIALGLDELQAYRAWQIVQGAT